MRPVLKYLLLSFSILPLFAAAQKLPKIQTAAVRAPQNIKIDGKTTEWNDKFKAYNFGQHIYYTLSNDDTNLYLTVRMDDALGSRKILKGGLTFSIIPSTKTERLSIAFPVITKSIMDTEQPGGTPILRYNSLQKSNLNPAAKKTKTDSLIASANAGLLKAYKQMYITGIPEITDSLVSIYNTHNIQVTARYDKSMNYTYELAIPLRYLEAAITNVRSLKYNIKLHTIPPMEMKIIEARNRNRPPVVLGRFVSPGSLDDQFIYGDTDFSGEYTLAK